MLIVRRKEGESILIGGSIEVHLVESSSSGAKIGIRAPQDVVILRKEIAQAGEQNRAAQFRRSAAALKNLAAGLRRLPDFNPPNSLLEKEMAGEEGVDTRRVEAPDGIARRADQGVPE